MENPWICTFGVRPSVQGVDDVTVMAAVVWSRVCGSAALIGLGAGGRALSQSASCRGVTAASGQVRWMPDYFFIFIPINALIFFFRRQLSFQIVILRQVGYKKIHGISRYTDMNKQGCGFIYSLPRLWLYFNLKCNNPDIFKSGNKDTRGVKKGWCFLECLL